MLFNSDLQSIASCWWHCSPKGCFFCTYLYVSYKLLPFMISIFCMRLRTFCYLRYPRVAVGSRTGPVVPPQGTCSCLPCRALLRDHGCGDPCAGPLAAVCEGLRLPHVRQGVARGLHGGRLRAGGQAGLRRRRRPQGLEGAPATGLDTLS